MSNTYNTSGTTLGNQRLGTSAISVGRRPITSNVIDGSLGGPLNDGDYPGDLIVGVSEISDLYNNRFIASSLSSGSSQDIYWNHSITGNISPTSSGLYTLGVSGAPLASGFFNRIYMPIGSQNGIYSPNNLTNLYLHTTNGFTFRINGNDDTILDGGFLATRSMIGLGASALSPDIRLQRLSSAHLCFNNTVNQTRLSIANSHSSASLGEWLRLGFETNTGIIFSDASGTGVHRPLVIQAGSGSNRTTLGLTTANSGQITYGVAPLSGPSGLSRIPIIISGVQYYLLASTS